MTLIKTERLILKPLFDDSKEAMIELLANEKVKETFMIPDFRTEDEKLQMFQILQSFSLSEEHFVVGINLNDKLIGFMNDMDIQNGKIELGYVINPEYHNYGYATEALKGAIDDLFAQGFNEVIAAAFDHNLPSIKVMVKCGMTKMEKQEDIEYHGNVNHCIYYSVKKKDL